MSKDLAQDVWKKASKHLRELLHPDVYSRWIAIIKPGKIEDGVLSISVNNDFYQSWLEDNYLPLISNAISSVYDEKLEIKIKIEESEAVAVEAKPVTKKKTVREHIGRRSVPKPVLNPKFTFDTFIVGPSNNFAHAAALAVGQAPARAYNPLFIYGGVGLGKTHLMQAIGQHVLTTSRANVCYLSSEALLNEYIEALTKRSLVQFRKKYRNTDLLLIDDIHFLAGKNQLQEEFFHTFNALFDAHKQIVMTSDRPASEITGLEKRLVSRFEWGLVTELESPDLETRIAILRNRLAEADGQLPDEILLFIAEKVSSNIRRLEGALVRVMSYASLTNKEITIDSTMHLLRDILEQERQSDLSFESIQRTVAEHYDIRLTDMSSKHRPRSVAVPRQVAMYLCRRLTKSSLPDIANAFGKTHATVLHAYKTIDNRMDVDEDLKQNVSELYRKLGRALV